MPVLNRVNHDTSRTLKGVVSRPYQYMHGPFTLTMSCDEEPEADRN